MLMALGFSNRGVPDWNLVPDVNVHPVISVLFSIESCVALCHVREVLPIHVVNVDSLVGPIRDV